MIRISRILILDLILTKDLILVVNLSEPCNYYPNFVWIDQIQDLCVYAKHIWGTSLCVSRQKVWNIQHIYRILFRDCQVYWYENFFMTSTGSRKNLTRKSVEVMKNFLYIIYIYIDYKVMVDIYRNKKNDCIYIETLKKKKKTSIIYVHRLYIHVLYKKRNRKKTTAWNIWTWKKNTWKKLLRTDNKANLKSINLLPNQSENGNYNLISVWFNMISKIFLCVLRN